MVRVHFGLVSGIMSLMISSCRFVEDVPEEAEFGDSDGVEDGEALGAIDSDGGDDATIDGTSDSEGEADGLYDGIEVLEGYDVWFKNGGLVTAQYVWSIKWFVPIALQSAALKNPRSVHNGRVEGSFAQT